MSAVVDPIQLTDFGMGAKSVMTLRSNRLRVSPT
jgi:hypothetical protein